MRAPLQCCSAKESWQPVAETWREKQLSYTWLRATAGCHTDFWTVTRQALDWTLEYYDLVEVEGGDGDDPNSARPPGAILPAGQSATAATEGSSQRLSSNSSGSLPQRPATSASTPTVVALAAFGLAVGIAVVALARHWLG